jgi:3-isopropylmalate dehydrogenase
MMCRYSLDAPVAADGIERAVNQVLAEGFRTADIAPDEADAGIRLVGTEEMGEAVLAALNDGES